jgi:hypothetical protein
MADYYHTRRQIITALFLVFLFITFTAASAGYWIHWAILTFATFMWLICDFMFLEQTQFVFEPNIYEWQKKSKLDYF